MVDKDLIPKLNFFSDVPQDKIEEISNMCDLLEFKQNDIIFNQDDTAKNLYGVLDGEVELSLIFEDKILKTIVKHEKSIHTQTEVIQKPIIVDTVETGDVFGWSSLMDSGSWTTTAQCSINSRILSVPAVDLKAMFSQDPSMGYMIMRRLNEIISRRLHKRTAKLVEIWVEFFDADRI